MVLKILVSAIYAYTNLRGLPIQTIYALRVDCYTICVFEHQWDLANSSVCPARMSAFMSCCWHSNLISRTSFEAPWNWEIIPGYVKMGG